MKILAWVKKVPWIVWAAITPALIIGGVRLWTGGTKRIVVVGAGVIHLLEEQDAPEGTRLDLDLRAHERIEDTVARVESELSAWPDILVISFDAAALEGAGNRYREELLTLVEHAEASTTVPVVLAPAPAPGDGEEVIAAAELETVWWREELCQERGLRVCVDLWPYVHDPEGMRRAMTAGIAQGLVRHQQWRASTQVGR